MPPSNPIRVIELNNDDGPSDPVRIVNMDELVAALQAQVVPGTLGSGTHQGQVIITGANPFVPGYSTFSFAGTTGGKTVFAVTNNKTLTLISTDNYNLTIPATGTAALREVTNTFTLSQYIDAPGSPQWSINCANISGLVCTYTIKRGGVDISNTGGDHWAPWIVYVNDVNPVNGHDLIAIGKPPDFHMAFGGVDTTHINDATIPNFRFLQVTGTESANPFMEWHINGTHTGDLFLITNPTDGLADTLKLTRAGDLTLYGAITAGGIITATGNLVTSASLNSTRADIGGMARIYNGADLVINGTFPTNTANWSALNATLSVDTAHLRVTKTSGTGKGTQLVSVIVGKRYKLTYTYIGKSAGASIYIQVGDGSNWSLYHENYSPGAGVPVTVYITPTGTTMNISPAVYGGAAGDYTDWDNISLVPMGDLTVEGNLGLFGHALAAQPTKAGHNNWANISDVTAALAAIGLIDVA